MFKCTCGDTNFKAIIRGAGIVNVNEGGKIHVVQLMEEYTQAESVVCCSCNKEYSVAEISKIACKKCGKMHLADELNEKGLCEICSQIEERFADYSEQDYVAKMLEMEKRIKELESSKKVSKPKTTAKKKTKKAEPKVEEPKETINEPKKEVAVTETPVVKEEVKEEPKVEEKVQKEEPKVVDPIAEQFKAMSEPKEETPKEETQCNPSDFIPNVNTNQSIENAKEEIKEQAEKFAKGFEEQNEVAQTPTDETAETMPNPFEQVNPFANIESQGDGGQQQNPFAGFDNISFANVKSLEEL